MKTISSIKSKSRIIGDNISARITKNKITGKRREIEFPIYYDYGIDDIGSMIDFIIEEDHWKVKKQTIVAVEFSKELTKAKLITEIEKDLQLGRKPKYE